MERGARRCLTSVSGRSCLSRRGRLARQQAAGQTITPQELRSTPGSVRDPMERSAEPGGRAELPSVMSLTQAVLCIEKYA